MTRYYVFNKTEVECRRLLKTFHYHICQIIVVLLKEFGEN